MDEDALRIRIHALIHRQRELLQHLEDTLDDDEQADKRGIYVSHILKASWNIQYFTTLLVDPTIAEDDVDFD